MPEKTESLLAELEQILGMTKKEAVKLELAPIKELATKSATLIDTYRSIAELARRELQCGYDRLFQQVGGVGAPVHFVTEAFAEQEKAQGLGQKRSFEDAKKQFNDLLGAHGSETEGEPYVPADGLLKVLENLIRPPWWKPGHGNFLELDRNLETIIRLATPLRNAVGWAVANGHEADEQQRAQIDEQVSILRIQHADYEQTFAPEVRRRILCTEFSIRRIAALIFDSSEYFFRPVRIVAAAKRLESPAREGALAVLASALAVDILHDSGISEQRLAATHKRLQPLMGYEVAQLFPKDKVERLNEWMAKTENFLRHSTKDIEEQLGELAERLTNLESIVSRSEQGKDQRQGRVKALVENILELLREETTDPWNRWPGKAAAVVGNYCELLWENSIDEAFGRDGDPDKFEEWQWLELRRSVTELALGFREGVKFGSRGWKP